MDLRIMLSFFLAGLLHLTNGQSNSPTCFQEGECVQSPYVSIWETDDAQDCLQRCQGDGNCQYFTFYEYEEDCVGFSDCVEFSEDSCTGCYSGEKNCQDLQCWEQGQCVGGQLIQSIPGQSSEGCLEFCKIDDQCLWFSFNEDGGACDLYSDCPGIDRECTSCFYGQKPCAARKSYTKIIVVGGSNYLDRLTDVEYMDFEDPSQACNTIANYPTTIAHNALTFINGVIKSCGGNPGAADNLNTCYDYDPEIDAWVEFPGMMVGRSSPAHSIINGQWFITGGGGSYGDDSSEIWTPGVGFTQGPQLPEEMGGHCQATINSTHVLIVNPEDLTTYALEWETFQWTTLSGPSRNRYNGPACGLVTSEANGLEFMVVSDGNSEVYNIASDTWRFGPSLPYGYSYASAQLYDTFVVVGGYDTDELDAVYEFAPENYVFVDVGRLIIDRSGASAVGVPDGYIKC